MSYQIVYHPSLVGVSHLVPTLSPARVFASCADTRSIVAVTAALPTLAVVGQSAVLDADPGAIVSLGGFLWIICADGTLRKFTIAATPVQSASFDFDSITTDWLCLYGSVLIVPGVAGTLLTVSTAGAELGRAEGILPRISMVAVDSSNGYAYAFDGHGRGIVVQVNGTTGRITLGNTFSAPNMANLKAALVDGDNLILISDAKRMIFDITDPTAPVIDLLRAYPAEHLTGIAVLDTGSYYYAAQVPPDGFPFPWIQGPACSNNGLIVGLPHVGALVFVNPALDEDGDSTVIVTVPLPVAPSSLVAMAGNTVVGLTWSAAGGADTYNVYRGTVSGTYTLIASGIIPTLYNDTTVVNTTTYYYVVTGTSTTGEGPRSNEQSATPSAGAPVNTVAPVVTGTALVGQVLSCSTGTWTGDPTITYAYQWRRDAIAIGGEMANTYTTVIGDLDHAIDCVVTATNSGGSTPQDSNDIQILSPPVNTVAPVASGGPVVGQTVSCSTGTWTGSPTIVYTYQWRRDGSDIGSATNSTYVLVTADDAHAVDCVVTGTNGAGNSSQDTNNISVISAPVNTVAGVLSGGTNFGSTLTCTSGTWTGTATITFTYQFKANGVNIGSPGGNTYVTVFADAGKTITCVVIGTNAAGSVNGTASNGIVVQSASPLAGYRVWYDVTQLAGKSDGDLISMLPDLAGVINADQTASGTARPTYKTSILNGYPALQFDGTSDFTSWTGSNFFLSGASTVFCVIAAIPAPAIASYAMPFSAGGTGNEKRYCNSYTTGGVSSIHCGVGAGATCAVNITGGENLIIAMKYDGASSLLRLNGDTGRQNATSINVASPQLGTMEFGRDPTSVNHWAGMKLVEFLNYPSALGSTDFATVESYLKAKYGL